MDNQNKEAFVSNDIRISYTYQADIDDMKSNREKITEYLDSSDPYNADVIFGREKTSISSYAGQSEGKSSYNWFVIMLAGMLTVVGIQMLCGKLLEGTRYYVLQEYVQMIPVSILFMIVAVYAEISIITGNTRQKREGAKAR